MTTGSRSTAASQIPALHTTVHFRSSQSARTPFPRLTIVCRYQKCSQIDRAFGSLYRRMQGPRLSPHSHLLTRHRTNRDAGGRVSLCLNSAGPHLAASHLASLASWNKTSRIPACRLFVLSALSCFVFSAESTFRISANVKSVILLARLTLLSSPTMLARHTP